MNVLLKDFATKRYWRRLLTSTFVCLGAISTVLQTITVIEPTIVFFQGWKFLVGVSVVSLLWGIYRSWPRPITEDYSSPKTKISILEGDILNEKGHLVIGTTDTFDTETPVIIAKTSLQGQVLSRLYGDDLKEMDQKIENALTGKKIVGTIQKAGKQNQYGIGTIATVKESGRLLFFLAYCEMDNKNKASTTPDKIWKSLLTLWDEVSQKANGGIISMPAIGGGQSRISSILPAQDSIRLIILSFMFASRNSKVSDELRIVVTPADFKKLDRLELQSFLSSLRSS